MTNTEFPADQGESRDYIALERKVADLANALASGGSRFVTGDLIPHWGPTREGAVLCDGTIYLDTDPIIGDALALLLRSQGFFTDATHVQVPDYTGRAIGGVGGSLGAFGAPVGSDTVTLTAAQSGQPGIAAGTTGAGSAHSHTGTTNNANTLHTHSLIWATAAGGVGGGMVPPNNGVNGGTYNTSTDSTVHSHTFTTATESAHTHSTPSVAAAPAASSHTNIQPTLPAYIFIKT